MTSLWTLLRQNRNYRYTWMAQVVSEVGDYFNNIAVFALVMEKSGSGLVVTGVMLSRAIPAVLAGPVAGVLLDRLDRRRIMIASDLLRALIAALRQLADPDHAVGHADGGHAAGWIQRGMAGVLLGVRAQFAIVCVFGVRHLADLRARRIPRQA